MIITCPKCARNHKVNPDTLKPFADAGKKNILASCKSCKFKFPVSLSSLLTLDEKPVDTKRRPGGVARKICITLSKGGVGKTTTSVNLGAGLALAGYRVLLVDTDTQGQSSYILGKKP
ncbi:MAG: chromosome partitioning protein, partial [Thermodesulfobacteriota bacterium]|nr:chromosome partitioning protein [Thermodesulfobacteriota bacterium]